MDLVTLDFETYYDTKLSLTKMTTMEYVKHPQFKVWGVGIKLNDEPAEWYSADEVEDALHQIPWDNVSLLCHNTLFDGYILSRYYGIKPKQYLDTAAMARGSFPGLSASLKETSIRLFPDDESMRKGEDLAKAKGHFDLPPEIEEDLARYCLQDVELTYAVYQKLIHRYPMSEIDLIHLTTRMFCDPVLKIDRERLTAYHEQEFTRAEELIKACGVDREVLASNDKFVAHLATIGITPPTKRSPTTGKQIPAFGKNDAGWKQLVAKYPQHKPLWDARQAVKSRITETRAKRFLDVAHHDDTISVPLRYYAAHTGRFGGTEKINLQNLPRGSELRKVLIAPEGHLVYVADLSNIEARMLAWLAGQDDLLDQFRRGEDIYSNFASKIYNRPVDKHNNPTERFVGKTAILGLGYGMGHNKFKLTIETGAAGPAMQISETDALNVVHTYRTTYDRIPVLWARLENLLKQSLHRDNFNSNYRGVLTVQDRSLVLPNSMALRYENLEMSPTGLTYQTRGTLQESTYGGRITENVIQALSRIVITNSLLRLDKDLPNARVALTVHDEVVIVAPEENPDATMARIIEDLCTPPHWAPDLPLSAEGGYDRMYSK
jgi:DNA polymerase bacteriophage-type